MVHYELSEGVLVQEVLSETVLLDTGRGEYFELNDVGSAMLTHLRDSGDPQAAFDRLLNEYDVAEDVLRQDFDELIGQLEDNGLLRKRP